MPKLSYDEIVEVGIQSLSNVGVPHEAAHLQMSLLLNAELSGLPSHGLLRLPRVIARIKNGVTSPTATGVIDWFASAMARVDGQQGLGPVVAMTAIEQAMDRAKTTGVATVALKNCDHLGMLAFYAEHVAKSGMVMLGLTISEALVHPWGGRHAMLGTNPIAIGVPAQPHPFVVDLATSLVAMGKIHDYANRDEPIPQGWALDKNGDSTTDPHQAKDGAIAPFGGAKGYALGVGFEIMVTALVNSAIGVDVVGTLDSEKPCNKGDVFIIMSPDSGGLQAVQQYMNDLRACAPADADCPVRVPGERALASREVNKKNGVTIPDTVWNQIVSDANAK